MARTSRPHATVADTLRAGRAQLTPAELRVAQALLANYPAAGLQPVAALAGAAGVSAPTVVRLVAKLGFRGFADMQARLRTELSARSAGPVELYPDAEVPQAASPLLRRVQGSASRAVSDSLRAVDATEFHRAVQLAADPAKRILVGGGRISTVLAQYLQRYLRLLRGDVHLVEVQHAARSAALLDAGAGTVVVVFDYRRYDPQLAGFGRAAAGAGAALVLFTDPYLSPLAPAADVLLTTTVDSPSPFITVAPAFALVEALVLGVVEALGPSVRGRLERFDRLSADLGAP